MRSCARNVEVKTVLNQTWPIEGEEDSDGGLLEKSNQNHVWLIGKKSNMSINVSEGLVHAKSDACGQNKRNI